MPIVTQDKIANYIRSEFMAGKGTIAELAEKLGMARQNAHMILTGYSQPSENTCKLLGIERVYRVPSKSKRKAKE